MGIDQMTLSVAKGYVKETVLGGGAVVGKNVTISSITPIDGGNRITFSYTLDNGTVKTSTLDVMNGVDGKDGAKGEKGDPGQNGQDGTNGSDGIGISKIEKTKTEGFVDTYTITFSDDSTFEYTVTNGKDGSGSSTGEENVIEEIKVNGTPLSPDENKSVDITVPDISGLATKEEITEATKDFAKKTDIPSLDEYAKSSDLSTVATSGSYNDLEDKPTIPTVDVDKNYVDTALTDYQKKTDETLNTIDKTVVGAINELKADSHTHDNKTDVLDKLSVNDEGTLLFNGNEIKGGSSSLKAGKDIEIKNNTVSSTIFLDDWKVNTDYEIGDKRKYDYKDYKCISSHTSTDTFDESKWELIGHSELHVRSIKQAEYKKLVENGVITDATRDLYVVSDGSGGAEIPTTVQWGNITGVLDNQADLKNALDDIKNNIPTIDVDKKYVDDALLKKASLIHTHTVVNGHSVESDVPSGAVFTDTVYDDTNIKTELAKKADTTALVDYATKTYVGEQISNADHLRREIVVEIPDASIADEHTIYMLKVEDATGNDKYREYLLIDGTVQCVGDTSVDLTDYAKTADIDKKLSNKADKTEIPTVPTKVSDFTNDAGYLTEHQDISNFVVKEKGKGLSSNDYTNEEKDKLGSIGISQGRNLIPYPYYDGSCERFGITWTVNEDGSVTANGTATKECPFNIIYPYTLANSKLFEFQQKYTFSDGIDNEPNAYTQIVRNSSADSTIYNYALSSANGVTSWTASNDDLLRYGIRLIIRDGATVDNVTFKPMLEIGNIAHAYEPTTESNASLKCSIESTNNDVAKLVSKISKVADVTKKEITLSYPSSVKENTQDISYNVTNGICTINYDLSFTTTSGVEWTVIATGLPKPLNGDVKRTTQAHNGKDNPLILNVNSSCNLVMYMIGTTSTTNPHYIDSFSYPVAKS